MKKIILIMLVLMILLVLPSCGVRDGEVDDRIVAPNNNMPPIQGKWVIEEEMEPINSTKNKDADSIIGEEALFHKDGAVLGKSYTLKPSFKLKKVKTYDYLLYKYKTSPSNLGITDEKIQVITVMDDNKYFNEFIKYSDSVMFVNIEDHFYKMVKTVDEVSIEEINRYINVEKSMLKTFGAVEEEDLQTGVLLGLKIPIFDEKNQVPKWDYKTIWINSQNKEITDIYELDQLLVPRKNGFWVIDSVRDSNNGAVNDELIATPQFKLKENLATLDDREEYFGIFGIRGEFSQSNISLPSILKNILFVGNDYISVENTDLDRNSRKTLQVYAIDNLSEKKPIKLSDLIGDEGMDIFYEGASSVVSLDNSIIPNEENVGVIRRNGFWTLKGRINYKQNDEELYKDFNIKAIPPKEMVSFDELSIPWDAIRIMIPDVVDVFSSPNEEFIVVITSSHLVIYSMQDEGIVNSPIARIKLPYDSKIIMSEWAVGRYSNIWQEEVIKKDGVKLEY
ncbi:hypothetical protein [Paratissierella segnis]|jgi:hypothetical protein|uniref:Lipoprotein n=1 Tax=Paratissierella segnis TaxID=2763679 RepID=A0A926EYR5_9FIRM|nr:hypothetical protein [Paratissierella segnis]MBC8588744.1 hypothetical protein [Paratissierella segnis]